jgi:hypothetical protein
MGTEAYKELRARADLEPKYALWLGVVAISPLLNPITQEDSDQRRNHAGRPVSWRLIRLRSKWACTLRRPAN